MPSTGSTMPWEKSFEKETNKNSAKKQGNTGGLVVCQFVFYDLCVFLKMGVCVCVCACVHETVFWKVLKHRHDKRIETECIMFRCRYRSQELLW